MRKVWVYLALIVLVLTGSGFLSFYYIKKIRVSSELPHEITQSDYMIAPAIIDAPNDVTHIAALQSGIIKQIHVKPGQFVKKGQLLFSLRDELVNNTIKIHRLNIEKIQKEGAWQEKHIAYLQRQINRLKSLDQRAISRAELQDKIHELAMAKAHFEQTKEDLDLARANLKNAKLTHHQYKIHALKDGIILQINAHVNEYVQASQEIFLMADAKKVIVRVSIDERDIKRFKPGAKVYLINYQNDALNIPLKFIQLDQYIITQERLGSRVQEALYSFNRKKYPQYSAGQLFDAHIDTKDVKI